MGASDKAAAFVFRIENTSDISIEVFRTGTDGTVYLYYMGTSMDVMGKDSYGSGSSCDNISLSSSSSTGTLSKSNCAAGYYQVYNSVRYGISSITITAAGGGDCTSHSVTLSSSGSVTGGTFTTSSATVCEGETATLTATPAAGYEFTSWSATGTGGHSLSSTTTNPATLTMGTADVTVNATFSPLYASGTYQFDVNNELGTAPNNKTCGTGTDSNFRIDNIFFSGATWEYDDGGTSSTGDGDNYQGWKWKTKDATIKFLVEEDCDVTIGIGTIKTGGGATITYTNQSNVLQSNVALTAATDNPYKVKGGTLVTITHNNSTNTVTLKKIIISSGSCPSAYSFHYGTDGQSDWTTECFTKVGDTHKWTIENFEIPDKPNFYVGWQGSDNAQTVTKAWTDGLSDTGSGVMNGAMVLLPTNGSVVGNATGAIGTLEIWDNSSSKNQYVGFKPDGYAIMYGGNNYAFSETATSNVWETDLLTLPDVSTTYQVGIKTSSSYTTCSHSKSAEALSTPGNTTLKDGKKYIYLNAGVWRTNAEGRPDDVNEKMAVWDATNVSGEWGNGGNFLTYNKATGLYEGYVSSSTTKIVLTRINNSRASLGNTWGDGVYNQTYDITLTTTNNEFTITAWHDNNDDKKPSTHTAAPHSHPATGDNGKFRMYDNSNDANWYVHWIPYYKLSYDGNGGTGSVDPSYRNSELSTSPLIVAANGFTREGWRFAGWNTNKYGTGTDYAPGDNIDITGDQTLYAKWERDIYLQSNVSWWYNDNAWFAVYCFDSEHDTNYKWVSMTRAEECSSPAVYKVALPGNNFDKVIFCRMKAADTETLSWDNKDNQTSNIAYPSLVQDKFTITNGDNGNACTGSWGTYSVPTYTVSAAASTAGYGTVSAESVTGVACGTSISASTNTLTVGATTVTATQAESTAQYTYAFTNWTWSPAGSTVTSDVTATANFTRTLNSYTVTWKNGATTLETDASVNYGATPSYDGSTPTKDADALYTYAFSGWSPAVGAISGNTTYTAQFTATPKTVAYGDATIYAYNDSKRVVSGTRKTAMETTMGSSGENGISGSLPLLHSVAGLTSVVLAGQCKSEVKTSFPWLGSYIKMKTDATTATITFNVASGYAGTATIYFSGYNKTATLTNGANSDAKTSDSRNPETEGSFTSKNIALVSGANTLTISGNNGYISRIDVALESSCTIPAAPTAFSAGSITSTGATFSITDAANAASYDIYYSTSSDAPTASTPATTTSTSKTKAVTGLTASTTYYAWVRSVCDADHKSAWFALAGSSFTTSAAGYTVTYDGSGAGGGAVPVDGSSPYLTGATVTVLGNTGSLTKTMDDNAATFLGWNTNSNTYGGTHYDEGDQFSMASSNVTLYAVWGFALNYNTDGGTINDDPYATYYISIYPDEEEITVLPTNVTKTGYTFAGWKTQNGSGSTVTAIDGSYTGAFAGDYALKAMWTAKTTTITINANTANHGSTAPSPIIATYGSALPSFTAATGEAGYSLKGYYTDATGGTKVIDADGTFSANSGIWNRTDGATLTLYAQYEEEGCTPQSLSKVVLSASGSSVIGTATGYNTNEYAGTPVVKADYDKTDAANIDGKSGDETGYKMGSDGNSIVFATLAKGTFQEGDVVKIGITRRNDTRVISGDKNILTIYYGNSKSDADSLTTISTGDITTDGASAHEGAGFYEYELTAADATKIGSKKGIGLFRASKNGENPYVYSVEIIGCREWATCTAPTAVVAGSVTATGATFTITDALNTNNYEIYYSTSSTTPTAETSATATTGSKTKAVTGLTAETTYYYWVRSNCGDVTKSAWVAGTPTSFTTLAAAATNNVTYYGNGSTGGSVPTDATGYAEGDVVTVLGNTGSLVKTGQTFLGWSTSATASSGTFYPVGYKFEMPDAAVNLYAVWGSTGATCVTLTDFETGTHDKNSSGKPDSEGKYFYGYKGTKSAAYAVTITTLTTGTVGVNGGDNLQMAQNTRFNIYADNTTTSGTPATFSNITSISFKIKAVKNTKIPTIDVYVGSTKIKTVTGGSESSDTDGHEYDTSGFTTITVPSLSNLAGIVKFVNTSSGSSDYKALFDDIQICYGSGAASGFTVSFNIGWYREAGCTNAWNFGSSTISKDTTLYAKWTTCAPSISAHPVAATYTQDAAATALSVTATGDGLNYQWYTSEDGSADISGSSAIPGATSASYTPSTSLLGTIYYFCVVSNTCGNAVSNKAAITVNDSKPAPTAVWNIEEPKEGGKGFTFSIDVNKNDGTTNWDGELIASMLTLSDNAILDGASIVVNNTNKTISGTYGVKAGSSSPVTFYLLLPATATQSATRLDHDRTFTPCAGGGVGDSYNVPVRKDYEKDASNNYRWVTPGAGEITYAVNSSISSAKASSAVGEFDSIMSNDKQFVWVKTYEANTKTIRLHVETSGANISVNALYKNTVYATAADKDIVSSDDYSVSYDGSGSAENTGTKGTHYMDITFDSPLDANDIICIKFSSSKVKAYGAVLTTVGDGGDQTTGLTWSNDQASGANVEKQEDAADFTITAVRDTKALKSLGLISYTSSNTAIATVNASTGLVHIADNIDFGSDEFKTTTITATLAASGCYKKAVITYILKVTKHECEDTPGTITYVDRGCSGMDLTLDGYEEGATIKWYKNGTEIPSATSATYNATEPGEYYAVTHKTCDITSTNSITLEATTATAEKIVDQWYVKNGRRTPDIALVQTTGATNFTVTSGGTITEIDTGRYDDYHYGKRLCRCAQRLGYHAAHTSRDRQSECSIRSRWYAT